MSTLDQALSLRQPSDVQLSADGERVAFAVAGVVHDEENEGRFSAHASRPTGAGCLAWMDRHLRGVD